MVTESNMKRPLKVLQRIHVLLSSKYCNKTKRERELLHCNNLRNTSNDILAQAYNKYMVKSKNYTDVTNNISNLIIQSYFRQNLAQRQSTNSTLKVLVYQ